MSATAITPSRTSRTRSGRLTATATIPGAVVWTLLGSRALSLGAGAVAALTGTRAAGWRAFDTAGISASLGSVGNVLAASSVRWDSIHYLQIAAHGYRRAPNTCFFPLYPMLVRVGGWLTGSNVAAGIAISAGAFAVALLLLHRLTELELGGRAADATVLLLGFAPLSFFFTAVYTEALFLALSVGAVYAARRERWAIAWLLAALSAATRITGILIVLPLAWLLWRSPRRSWLRAAGLLGAPLALGSYFAYLHGLGYGWLAPIANESDASYGGVLVGPFTALGYAVGAAEHGLSALFAGAPVLAPTLGGPFSLDFQSVLLLGVAALALLALVLAFRRLPGPYGAYALLALSISISAPNIVQPLEGVDRYLLVIFPLWMAAGAWLSRRRWLLAAAVGCGGGLLAFYAFEFASWSLIA